MHASLEKLAHRPWELPVGEWVWRQSWCDLAFLHWPVPLAVLEPHVPRELRLQTFDGSAWIGVVPFRMEGVMRRPWPDVPWMSAFPELNVRTYVEHGAKPGVWFFSLDATNALAVMAARRWFHLPYHRARIGVQRAADGAFDYVLARADDSVRFEGRYAPVGGAWHAIPGTIEHFLTERYCLYARRPDGRLLRVDVHHGPWPLQRAELELHASTMTVPYQLALDEPPALLHFADRVDVVAWPPELL